MGRIEVAGYGRLSEGIGLEEDMIVRYLKHIARKQKELEEYNGFLYAVDDRASQTLVHLRSKAMSGDSPNRAKIRDSGCQVGIRNDYLTGLGKLVRPSTLELRMSIISPMVLLEMEMLLRSSGLALGCAGELCFSFAWELLCCLPKLPSRHNRMDR